MLIEIAVLSCHTSDILKLVKVKVKVKVKISLNRPRRPRGEVEVEPSFYFNLGARRGWVVSTTLRLLYPRGKTRYPLYRRLGRNQSRSGRVRKISPPPGFDPRTV